MAAPFDGAGAETAVVLLSAWGNPELGHYLSAFLDTGVDVAAVICAGEVTERERQIVVNRTAGHFTPIPLFELPIAATAFHFVDSHNGAATQRLLETLGADLLVNAGTPEILKAPLLATARRGVLNCHPGLLPAYRGCSCVEWAVYNDDPVGATCHFMDAGIDDGPVVLSRTLSVPAGTSYERLRADMVGHATRLLADGVVKVLAEDLRPEILAPQAEGRYHPVMPEEKLTEVRRKLAEDRYRPAATR